MAETIEEKQADFETWPRAMRRDKEWQARLGLKKKKRSTLQEIQECQSPAI